MQVVSVMPAESGWSVKSNAIANEMLFRNGGRAERAARRLAHALAARGEFVELRIHLRDGSLAGRFVCPPARLTAAGPRRGARGRGSLSATIGAGRRDQGRLSSVSTEERRHARREDRHRERAAAGKTYRVDAAKYGAAREAMLAFLPTSGPGMTQGEMAAAMRAALPADQFPGTTSSWWMKAAQLDLEAKGLVVREKTKPLRWRKA